MQCKFAPWSSRHYIIMNSNKNCYCKIYDNSQYNMCAAHCRDGICCKHVTSHARKGFPFIPFCFMFSGP